MCIKVYAFDTYRRHFDLTLYVDYVQGSTDFSTPRSKILIFIHIYSIFLLVIIFLY